MCSAGQGHKQGSTGTADTKHFRPAGVKSCSVSQCETCCLPPPALEGAQTSTWALGPRALPTTAAGRLSNRPKHWGSLLGMPASMTAGAAEPTGVSLLQRPEPTPRSHPQAAVTRHTMPPCNSPSHGQGASNREPPLLPLTHGHRHALPHLRRLLGQQSLG